MTDSTPLPGFRGTRAELLIAIKKAQPVSTKALAATLGVTANALRRHLKELEVEGVVDYRRVIQGVGGPVFTYSLTQVGERLFPRTYDAALGEALEMVREQLGVEGVVALFRRRWEQVTGPAKAELAGLPMPERSRRLAALLTSMGYMAESEADGADGSTLREHNCTIRLVVERFPEVCAAEQRFIAEVLGAEVTRQAHMATGANCCEYCIATPDSPPLAIQRSAAHGPALPVLQETA